MATVEKTYRAYTHSQGETYAAGRPGYSPELFKIVVNHHTSTGGRLGTVLDVGCGTGQATRDLASYFANAIGLDPSEGMIGAARSANASISPSIRFDVSAAEALGSHLQPPIADSSVDLITVATAAHWFDMDRFWHSAARVLKPGGTVAIWARTGMTVDPVHTPNGMAIKAATEELFEHELLPYAEDGNKLTRELYAKLPLPWTLDVPVPEFDQESFSREVWDKSRQGEKDLLGTSATVTLAQFEKVLGTRSSVARWRQAHPEKVGTEDDLVRKTRTRIESLLHEVGVESGKEALTGQVAIVLLMVKKRL